MFTLSKGHSLPRGTSRIAVNKQHNMVAVGWLDNKAVNFISTSDTTAIKSVQQHVGCEKQEVLYVTTKSIWVALIGMTDCSPSFHWVNNTSLRNIMSS